MKGNEYIAYNRVDYAGLKTIQKAILKRYISFMNSILLKMTTTIIANLKQIITPLVKIKHMCGNMTLIVNTSAFCNMIFSLELNATLCARDTLYFMLTICYIYKLLDFKILTIHSYALERGHPYVLYIEIFVDY